MILKPLKGSPIKTNKIREFTIKTNTIDIDAEYDFALYSEMIEEYLLEDLEVPYEYLESFKIHDDFINIKLSPAKKYFNDDWYVNLQRVG